MQFTHKGGIHPLKYSSTVWWVMTEDILICEAKREVREVNEEM